MIRAELLEVRITGCGGGGSGTGGASLGGFLSTEPFIRVSGSRLASRSELRKMDADMGFRPMGDQWFPFEPPPPKLDVFPAKAMRLAPADR